VPGIVSGVSLGPLNVVEGKPRDALQILLEAEAKPNPSCMHPLIMNTPSPPSKELEGLPAAQGEYWVTNETWLRVETDASTR